MVYLLARLTKVDCTMADRGEGVVGRVTEQTDSGILRLQESTKVAE